MATIIDLPAIKQLSWTVTTSYDVSTIILYNLALGTSGTDLSRVYEGHPNFHALPTFGCVPVVAIMGDVTRSMAGFLPNFKPYNHVHGNHFLKMKRAWPMKNTMLESRARVIDIGKRRNGVIVIVGVNTIDKETKEEVCYSEWTSFVLQVPGEGASMTSSTMQVYDVPTTRRADKVEEHRTSVEQSALYRAASGDLNPLHIDPEVARRGGFPGPLLTGTCTIGIGVRCVIDGFCEGMVERFESVRCKLIKPVFPGEVVKTEMWKDGRSKVVFRMVAGDEGRVVILGEVMIHDGGTDEGHFEPKLA